MLRGRNGCWGALLVVALLGSACSDDSPSGPSGGTETNVQGVPCDSDEQCGEELRCLPVPDAGKHCQKP